MPAGRELADFIRGHFRSIWSLELLLHLRRHPDRAWAEAELVDALRASRAVVATSLETLLAGGLILVDGEGRACYGPAGDDLRKRIDEIADLYVRKPDAVRRLIVQPAPSGVEAFADAFRLWRDD